MAPQISTNRFVYVIAYDSKLHEGQRIYLQTSPKRVGVEDIQRARRFGSIGAARAEAKKLKFGNPRIERHAVRIVEEAIDTFPCQEETPDNDSSRKD